MSETTLRDAAERTADPPEKRGSREGAFEAIYAGFATLAARQCGAELAFVSLVDSAGVWRQTGLPQKGTARPRFGRGARRHIRQAEIPVDAQGRRHRRFHPARDGARSRGDRLGPERKSDGAHAGLAAVYR